MDHVILKAIALKFEKHSVSDTDLNFDSKTMTYIFEEIATSIRFGLYQLLFQMRICTLMAKFNETCQACSLHKALPKL
jgi:hypothetical protein